MSIIRSRYVHTLLTALIAAVLAIPLVAWPAHASPATQTVKAEVTPGVHDLTIRIAAGSLSVEDGFLVIRNGAGTTLEKIRLAFINTDDRTYPIDAQVVGRTAKLTPSTDVSRSATTPAAVLKQTVAEGKVICGPQTRKQRDTEALNRMNSELSTAATIGGIVGAIIGGLIGLTGGPLAAVGGAIGAIVGAGGGLAGAAINGTFTRYFDTINSKFKPKFCKVT